MTPEENTTDQPFDVSPESREDGAHGRSRLTWVVAAVTVVVIVAALIWLLTRDGEQDGTDHGGINNDGSSATDPTLTRLELSPPPVPGRCADPRANPDLLGAAEVAFDATVTTIEGKEVTLEPLKFYAGEATDLVVVKQVGRDLQKLVGAVEFEEDERYLVAATNGRVMLCGFSAEYSGRLEGLYTLAFE